MRLRTPKTTVITAGVLAALVGIAVLAHTPTHLPSRPPAKPQPSPSKPVQLKKTTTKTPEGKGISVQAPKVGSTTITTVTRGNTTTITKTTVVGATNTSILKPQPTTPAIPGGKAYTIGMSFPSSGSTATAAFDALWTARHETPPTLAAPIQTAAVPWQSGTTWALVPIGLPDPSNGGPILWFGESSTAGKWTWIPTDVQSASPANLPLPIRQTLQWADNLAFNIPGPANLLGPHPWSTVTGQVNLPVAWSLQAQGNALNVWVWDPSTHYSPLYFAPQGLWTAANATTGHHALDQIVAVPLPLSKAVRDTQAP
ncbi:MAG: hypothetical protein M0Z36_01730 [Thermaerobacter sp.]|nr:hypothetical protein [Thermaerobacter sp.]